MVIRRAAQTVVLLWLGAAAIGWSQSSGELFERGEVLRKAGQYEEALELFDEVLEFDRDHSEAYRKRGLCWRDLGDFNRAYADYDRAIAADPGNANAYRSYAMALQKQERHADAIEWCDRGVAIGAVSSNLFLTRGFSKMETGDLEGAIDDHTRAIELDPENPWAFMHRGLCHHRAKSYRRALPDHDRALELNPKMSSVYHNRCLTNLKLERWKKAAADAERSIELGNTDVAIYRFLAKANRRKGDLRGALRAYDEVLERMPNDEGSLFFRGWTRSEVGDLEGAIEDNTRLIKLNPEHARAFNNRGSAHQKRGELEDAHRDFETALRLDPEYRLARNNQEIVEEKLRTAGRQPPGTKTGTQQPPPTTSGPAAIPDIVFSANDPCAAAAAPSDGLPWQETPGSAPELPTDVAAATLSPPLELESLSSAQYAGAVSIAKEGMRLLYGVMQPEQALLFEKVWAPMFTNPTDESIAYLNQLNPLIGQFIAGREALIRAGASLQAATFEAALAVEADLPEAWADAMAMADLQTRTITSLEAGLGDIALRIHELGNPPNPQAARCEALRRYRRSFPRGETSPVDGVWTDAEGKVYSISTVTSPAPGVYLIYSNNQEYMDRIEPLHAAGYDVSKADLIEIEGPDGHSDFHHVAGIVDMLMVAEEQPDGSVLVTQIQEAMFGDTVTGWSFIEEGVADWTAVSILPSYFNQDPEWRQSRRWRDDSQEPFLAYQHDPEYVDSLGLRLEEMALEGVAGIKTRRASYVEAVLAAEVPEAREAAPTPVATATPAPVVAAAPTPDPAVEETIRFHQSTIKILERNLEREVAELEREKEPKRRKELSLRAIQIQSDIQAERDLISSYRTGRLVHTRSAFDDFAHQQFIHNMRVEAARVDATRRIAAGVQRQIELLPEEQRYAMRRKAREVIDGKTIASGNVEKAKKLALALNDMVQGTWEHEGAMAEEKAIAAQEHEFCAQMVVMAAGSIVTGLGSAAMAQTFGETAALTLWSPHVIGGVWGATTGTIAGGPGEGASSALMYAHPVGAFGVQFVQGYETAMANPGTDWQTGLWEGAKSAGTGYLIGKAIQLGATLTCKGALAYYGKDGRLFKPIARMKPNVNQAFAAAKYKQDVDDANSLIDHFKRTRLRLLQTQQQHPAGSPQVQAVEAELKQLAASLNSSHHCKWLLKYKAHPSVRRAFSKLVDESYDEMMPEIYQRLQAQGYDTSNLRFKPIRNASSSGTSSMDLDLALQEHPGMVIMKNGKPVTLAQFQNDAQKAVNGAYHSVTGFSAKRSEINLTTSGHDEAFSNRALLRKDVNFDEVEGEDIANIGRVVKVKEAKIEGEEVLSGIAKTQAKCREASKEIENMLLPALRQKAAKAPPGSPEHQQLMSDIRYWEEMLGRFKLIGTQETNPYTILEIDRAIRTDTGGRGAQEVGDDLAQTFRRLGGQQ